MKMFIRRLVAFMVPIWIVLAAVIFLYLNKDVYCDFRIQGNYSWKYNFQILGDLATKKLLQSAHKYNSFVFGSSRSVSLYACYLQTRIPGSLFFHYASWNETIGGMYAKLRLIDSLNYQVENVIFYFDTDYTFDGDGSCNPMDHYLLTGTDRFSYNYKHFRSVVFPDNVNMLRILFRMPVNSEVFVNWESDPVTNDSQHQCNSYVISEYGKKEISEDQKSTVEMLKEKDVLYKRINGGYEKEPQISKREYQMMENIRKILNKHHTNYYVIITPLYDQLKFNAADMALLDSTFHDHLYDFSGINSYTENEYNYPDGKHFMPYISKEMADSVLQHKQL